MKREEIISEIQRLKQEKEAIILVHNYQRPEIQDIADYLGDSLGLSKIAAESDAKVIVFCGVRFMAESAKILSPEKLVLLPREDAGCELANMATREELMGFKSKYPDACVVSYVNTNADVKAESDVCCTSANAVKVVQNVSAKQIIFVPDRNLANYVQRFTDKEIIPWNGFCYVHDGMKSDVVKQTKDLHPDAKLIVHPECQREVIDLADKVTSTGGMVKFARESNVDKIIIGTEEGIVYRLQKENPQKTFYTAGSARMCRNMKITTLKDVLFALREEKYKIELPDHIVERARIALDKMLEYV
ncbi:quinolinate synthase NadA [candidate division WOR-3 bacterium]|nr:quinolinate synthase NadA [candidate division WOR-3 bacterium]